MVISSKKVRVPKTAELVADELRRRIVTGELKEDENLPPESVLIEEFGFSRPTIREAFRILETEELVTISRGLRGGAKIHQPQVEVVSRYAGAYLQAKHATLGEIANIRLIIEPRAVSLFAQRRNSEDIEACNAILDDFEKTLDEPEKLSHLTAEFHRRLIQGSGDTVFDLIGAMTYQIWEAHLVNVMGIKYSRKLAGEGLKGARKLMGYIAKGHNKAAEKFHKETLAESAKITFSVVSEDSTVELIS